ncbi:MAG: response regulator transcription factor [Actinobacteria bacterium]|nr:response regulator transcription factor [Actinomycetota bacterium]
MASGSWSGAVVDASEDPEGAFAFARQLSGTNLAISPVLLLIRGSQLGELEHSHDLFEDFCVTPFHPLEFEARVKHLLTRQGHIADESEIIQYKALVLNLETYQAAIDGTPLDLTYMEYELLKFLAQNPGRVFTRETLLSRVWGYEYYGGARTVDVHIRRLRAKLGEQHAQMISTVRSVGYRFGKSRWD